MNILWTVNKLPPVVAQKLGFGKGHAISWVEAMSIKLASLPNVHLSIVCPGAVNEVKDYKLDSINYYIIPNNCDRVDYWPIIINRSNPDVIHAYGTEGKHNVLLLKHHSDIPIVVSLQGIINEYRHHFYAGIDYRDMIRYTSIKDIVSPTCFFWGKRNYEKRALLEIEQLKLANNVEGRSTWDRVSALNINPNLRYFYCPRMIRQPFFEEQWKWENMIPHSILVHQGVQPLKGIHFVYQAVAKLKQKYPDITVYVVGSDFLHPKRLSRKVFQSGYAKYLKHLIREFRIEDIIHYTGVLSSQQLAQLLSKVNVHVVPSSIENAPNSLAESMIVGTPSIASFVGGNMDMLKHNEEGFLYCYNEPNMLAEYISTIFASRELAETFSIKSRETSHRRHDPDTLVDTLLNIYKDIAK